MIIITGQTGTGKTSLALELARARNGELLSADSRQVFSEMDLGTGKVDSLEDLNNRNGIWHLRGIPIYGINLIKANQIFSAGDFAEYGKNVIADIIARGKLPIVVGGTGFYLKSLLDPDETVSVPQDFELRRKYEYKPTQYLQTTLAEKDPTKLSSMNNSDRNNPRRLIRAIEVADWKRRNPIVPKSGFSFAPLEWIGLRASREVLEKRIDQRITQMLKNGLLEEVTKLVETYSWGSAGLTTIGYKEWHPYFLNQKTIDQVRQDILTAHLQYARKQLIYFKHLPEINWQEITG